MKTILVVDDDNGTRELLETILDYYGYNSIICGNGEEAILKIDKADALITDFEMPGMNGVELTKVVKAINPNMPVLIMTGNPNGVPSDHLADEVIEKPFNMGPILDWLSKV